MKYIKLFENSERFHKIGCHIAHGSHESHEYEEFTPLEIKIINDVMIINNFGENTYKGPNKSLLKYSNDKYLRGKFDLLSSATDINISKIKDEWFFVGEWYRTSTCYKCDQLDGLVSCLEELAKNDKNRRSIIW